MVKSIQLYNNPTPSFTSLAKFHTELVNKGLSNKNPLSEWRKSQIFDCLVSKNMKKGSETNVVLPYWQNTLIFCLNSYCNREVCFIDTHDRCILEKKQPDICIMLKGMTETSLNIIAVGELKGEKLTDSDRGQVEQYLHCLLKVQKFRHKAYGFLTNNDDFWVVYACRREDEISCTWCIEAQCGGLSQLGEQALSWLAGLSKEEHGYKAPVTLTGLQLEYCLGSGSVSFVYKGKYQGKSVVVKVYDSSECLDKEYNILNKLNQTKVPNIPKIVKKIHNALILTPVAEHLRAHYVKKSDVDNIVTTLYRAHSNGIVHRDIRNPNLFKIDDGVLVNDWGSAVDISGSAVDVSDGPKDYGALVEASDSILDAVIKDSEPIIDRRNDLHALARALFRLINLPPPELLPSQPSSLNDLRKIKTYWSTVNMSWRKIFELADKSDFHNIETYSKFADAISKQLPREL